MTILADETFGFGLLVLILSMSEVVAFDVDDLESAD